MRRGVTRPQARKGFRFPLEPSELRHLTRESALRDSDGQDVTIRHEHVETSDSEQIPLFKYVPGRMLVVFSVPESLPSSIAEAVRIGIRALQAVGVARSSQNNQSTSIVALFQAAEPQLNLVTRVTRFQRGAYRDGSKFSNAFKSRITDVTDTVFATLSLNESTGSI